jgi:hypothetical protein
VADGASLGLLAALPLVGLLTGPAYAGLVWALAAVRLVGRRGAPVVDWPLVNTAWVFLVVCLVGCVFSVAPGHSLREIGQLGLIWAGCLVLLADRSMPAAVVKLVFAAISVAVLVGVLMLCVDRALGFPLQRHLVSGAVFPETKYNRGVDYLSLLVWPVVGFWVSRGRVWPAIGVAAVVTVAATAGHSTTARVACVLGLVTWLCARRAPREAARVLIAVVVVLAVSLPLWVHALAADRFVLWHMVKPSFLHRLEIWDYMSDRVFERPWLGWGLGNAHAVPIMPAELSSYTFVDPHGVYPHNQWLELWLETGAVGVAVAVSFAMLAVRRIEGAARGLQPFMLAAGAAALAVSHANFELTTDSWWAALAVTAFLFRLASVVPAS